MSAGLRRQAYVGKIVPANFCRRRHLTNAFAKMLKQNAVGKS
jgi:hypothetical protein